MQNSEQGGKGNLFLIIGFLAIVAFILLLLFLQSSKDDDVKYNQSRMLKFVYEVSNKSTQSIPSAKFKTYFPLEETATQKVQEFSNNKLSSMTQDKYGNRVAEFDLGLIPPNGKRIFNYTLFVDKTDKPKKQTLVKGDKDIFLASQQKIQSDNKLIIDLAETLRGKTQQESAKAIYGWVAKNITYEGYVARDKGAIKALESRKGDCTEYAYLVVALARALEIPARAMGGYVVNDKTIIKASDYHNWAELYIDGIWRVVDAQEKKFLQNEEDYVAVRLILDSEISLLGSSHRFSLAQANLDLRLP